MKNNLLNQWSRLHKYRSELNNLLHSDEMLTRSERNLIYHEISRVGWWLQQTSKRINLQMVDVSDWGGESGY
jgi:hypothetical protein